jgi:hypothetical protein
MDTSYWKTLNRVENLANSILGFLSNLAKFSRICERIFLHTTRLGYKFAQVFREKKNADTQYMMI